MFLRKSADSETLLPPEPLGAVFQHALVSSKFRSVLGQQQVPAKRWKRAKSDPLWVHHGVLPVG